MKLLFWIVGVPLLLVAVFFAVANRETVAISLWPLAEPLHLPLFVAIVGPLYVGLLLGALTAWLAGGRARHDARAAQRRVRSLEQENAALRARLDPAGPGPTLPPPPAERRADLPAPLP